MMMLSELDMIDDRGRDGAICRNAGLVNNNSNDDGD